MECDQKGKGKNLGNLPQNTKLGKKTIKKSIPCMACTLPRHRKEVPRITNSSRDEKIKKKRQKREEEGKLWNT